MGATDVVLRAARAGINTPIVAVHRCRNADALSQSLSGLH